jgi:uncharacterized protein DUF1707
MAVLAGEHDRDRAAHELQRAYREGRLTVDELGERLHLALRARDGVQLRAALHDLPRGDMREALRSPIRAVRNGAILVGTAVVWLLWSVSLLAAFIAWLAADGPGLAGLLIFPALWFVSSWLLWTGSRRRRSRP